jgi:hypothetical protein
MRRGSLSERMGQMQQARLRLRKRPKARHGPYHSLTHSLEKKTRSRFLTAEEALVARQQIDAGRKFRAQVDAYWEVCEEGYSMPVYPGAIKRRRGFPVHACAASPHKT